MRIKLKNFKIWFKDQKERNLLWYNMIKSRNGWGMFHKYSHISQTTNQEKISYPTIDSALRAKEKMEKKTGNSFVAYKCLFCDGYHIGKPLNKKYIQKNN